MKHNSFNLFVNVKCKTCGELFPESILRLKYNPTLDCPACYSRIKYIPGTLQIIANGFIQDII